MTATIASRMSIERGRNGRGRVRTSHDRPEAQVARQTADRGRRVVRAACGGRRSTAVGAHSPTHGPPAAVGPGGSSSRRRARPPSTRPVPGLQQYAGRAHDGPQAKAYANDSSPHTSRKSRTGKTYSEVSTLARQNPNDANLQSQVQTLFRVRPCRGLLLNAWGWSVIARHTPSGAACCVAGVAIVAAAIT